MTIAQEFAPLKGHRYYDSEGKIIAYETHTLPVGEFGHKEVLEKIETLHSGRGISVVFGGFFSADIIRATKGKGVFCDLNANQESCYDALISMVTAHPTFPGFRAAFLDWEKTTEIPLRGLLSTGQPRAYRAIKNILNDEAAYNDFHKSVVAGDVAAITLDLMDTPRIEAVAELLIPMEKAGLVYLGNIGYYSLRQQNDKDFAKRIIRYNARQQLATNLKLLCHPDAIIVDAVPARAVEKGPGESFKLDAISLKEYILDISNHRGGR